MIQRSILVTFGAHPRLRIWRNSTGAVTTGNRFFRFGLVGSADILGILAPEGRFVAIEVKAAHGTQTEQQRRFQSMIERMGGIYVLARSTSDVAAALGI